MTEPTGAQGGGAIHAVTFDLDDTLWDIWPIIARAEARLHDWLNVHHPIIPARFSPLDLRRLASEIAQQQPEIAYDRSLLRKRGLQLAADLAGCQGFCVETAFEVFYAARNEVVLFAEVLPVLERLTERYTLGALSNGNADLRLVGLHHVFDFSINAVDVGAAKPAPAIFEAACERLAVFPQQIVHVGDDPESDVHGAAQAGLRTIWINREGKDWPGGQRADAEISTLGELEAVLDRWDEVHKNFFGNN